MSRGAERLIFPGGASRQVPGPGAKTAIGRIADGPRVALPVTACTAAMDRFSRRTDQRRNTWPREPRSKADYLGQAPDPSALPTPQRIPQCQSIIGHLHQGPLISLLSVQARVDHMRMNPMRPHRANNAAIKLLCRHSPTALPKTGDHTGFSCEPRAENHSWVDACGCPLMCKSV